MSKIHSNFRIHLFRFGTNPYHLPIQTYHSPLRGREEFSRLSQASVFFKTFPQLDSQRMTPTVKLRWQWGKCNFEGCIPYWILVFSISMLVDPALMGHVCAKAITRYRSLKVPCLLQLGSKPLQGLTGSRGVWWKKCIKSERRSFRFWNKKDNIHQWLFLVPLKGGR